MKSFTHGKRWLKSSLAMSFLMIISIGDALSECNPSLQLVNVTVKQLSIAPPTYEYSISNTSKAAIRSFKLGSGEQMEMEAIDDNIPTRVESPEGWEGANYFGEESGYMNIVWKVKEEKFAIKPNTMLGGFKVIMPIPVETKVPLYGPDGKLSVPLNMKNAPYMIRFKDGTCVWGRVVQE